MKGASIRTSVGLGMLSLALFVPACRGQQANPAPEPLPGVVVLDTSGSWRMHNTIAPPVVSDGGRFDTIVSAGTSGMRGGGYWQQLLARELLGPGAGWTAPEFDDSAWVRGPAAAFCRTPYLARLSLRGLFTVTDPAKVKDLALSLGYHGGAVVHLNGREIVRKDIAAGTAVADAYAKDAFVTGKGDPISLRGHEYLVDPGKLTDDLKRRIALRERKLDVPFPSAALRRGVNVLAIDLVRAPYDKVIAEKTVTLSSHGTFQVHELSWNTCELRHVQVRAASADGLVLNGTRPPGFQVWNSDPMAVDFDLDYGSRVEDLRPIRLVGCRNGSFSGKVVVGCDRPIGGLAATPGALTGPSGSIPASQVTVRYGLPWGSVPLTNSVNYEITPYPAAATPLLALSETAPDVIPVSEKEMVQEEIDPEQLWRYRKWGLGNLLLLRTPRQPKPVFGAVSSVWVTVRVPKDARPGTYTGQVVVRADGAKIADVPVELTVVDWTLPDPGDFSTWVELIQAPDTTAVEYELALWSERHWDMIERSLRFLGDIGSKVVYVPLIAESNAGNEQSMVRWIEQGDGKYAHDFSTMERYLDLVGKTIGKPRFIVFNVWDRYLTREGMARRLQGSVKLAIAGPLVTVVKPDGKVERVTLPDYPDPGGVELWKPLFDELHRRMAKRGWEDVMALGMTSDFWASKEQATALREITGGLPWVNASHYYQRTFHNGLSGFAYQTVYFGARQGYGRSLQGWNRPELVTAFERVGLDGFSISKWRMLGQQAVLGDVRGIGRLGADTWYVAKDRTGKRVGRVWDRYQAANWGYLNCNSSTLAPGPDGPVATQRYEALREGIQECEALVLLDRAVTDAAFRAKLGDELAAKCRDAVTGHIDCMWRSLISMQCGPKYNLDPTGWREAATPTGHTWFVGSDWQERTERLFALAGEVQKKLGI